MNIVEGIAHVFGDHINTDYIISGKHKSRLTDIKQMVQYLMEDIRAGFFSEIQPGDFIVAGINFGCGSSRETAAWVIKEAGISAVLAKGFARIFFRNAINIGLPALRVDTRSIHQGDRLRIDLNKGKIENLTRDEALTCQPLPPFIQKILDAGGMENYFKLHSKFEV
ncbi:MAG: 3-isopropylmalate dehydratase [Deltaproteobacteria bacterium]|nr:3-isopropylmalate dehydratase [Deltaproteobacteria bacterium]MBW2150520.1 3-isopropylmalate dehydratase [Deltaproteobacteria bacterium]